MAIEDQPTSGEQAVEARETAAYPRTYAPTEVTEPAMTQPDEATRPADAASRQYLQLAPPARPLATLGLGLLAAGLGVIGGVWLSRNRGQAARPIRTVGKVAARTDAALDLAPLVVQLLKNPVVREFALRMLVRQLTRRLPS